MFNIDSSSFDVIFVANATAGIKLVVEGFCGHPKGFKYTYLRDCHTSLVGVKGLAEDISCLFEDEMTEWIQKPSTMKDERPGLLAYPAQSNFNGRRFPLVWVKQLRENHPGWYSLLDAASYLTTTPLDYSDVSLAPDFTVLSFYKIFGYPDLGAVIVRRSDDARQILFQRRYFGGGTRAAMTADGFHAPRTEIHATLEDGTLPFHSILALDAAFTNFTRLYGNHMNISRHAASLTRVMYTFLCSLEHGNGRRVCELFSVPNHGPIVTFNLFSASGQPVGFAVFEKHSSMQNLALRTGGLCNPGGVQKYLDISNWEVERNLGKGRICGNDVDIIEGKNTGVIRVSFGACSKIEDVCAFMDFLREFYVEKPNLETTPILPMRGQSVRACMAIF